MTPSQIKSARDFTELNIETAQNLLTLHQDGKNAYRKEQIEGSLLCYQTILACLSACERITEVDGEELQAAIKHYDDYNEIHRHHEETFDNCARIIADIRKDM